MSTSIKEEKEQQVAEITEKFKKSKSFVIVEYKGITVRQDTDLRNAYRNANVEYKVLKNRLVKIALNNMGYNQFDDALNGSNAVAFGYGDISSPAKIASEKSVEFKKLTLKCGMLDGIYLDEATCQTLAKLPSKEVLISQLLGMFQAPMSSFARAIAAIAENKNA